MGVCRLCLGILTEGNQVSDPIVKDALEVFIPEMNHSLVEEAIVCQQCFDHLNTAYILLRHKIQSDETILDEMQKCMVSKVDLKRTFLGHTKKHFIDICRICLKQIEKDGRICLYKTSVDELEHEMIENMFEVCSIHVNLNISHKPVMCLDCWELLQKVYAFKSDFIAVEQKIRGYFRFVNKYKPLSPVDLEHIVNGSLGSNRELFLGSRHRIRGPSKYFSDDLLLENDNTLSGQALQDQESESQRSEAESSNVETAPLVSDNVPETASKTDTSSITTNTPKKVVPNLKRKTAVSKPCNPGVGNEVHRPKRRRTIPQTYSSFIVEAPSSSKSTSIPPIKLTTAKSVLLATPVEAQPTSIEKDPVSKCLPEVSEPETEHTSDKEDQNSKGLPEVCELETEPRTVPTSVNKDQGPTVTEPEAESTYYVEKDQDSTRLPELVEVQTESTSAQKDQHPKHLQTVPEPEEESIFVEKDQHPSLHTIPEPEEESTPVEKDQHPKNLHTVPEPEESSTPVEEDQNSKGSPEVSELETEPTSVKKDQHSELLHLLSESNNLLNTRDQHCELLDQLSEIINSSCMQEKEKHSESAELEQELSNNCSEDSASEIVENEDDCEAADDSVDDVEQLDLQPEDDEPPPKGQLRELRCNLIRLDNSLFIQKASRLCESDTDSVNEDDDTYMPGDRDSESDDLFDEEEKHEVSTDSLDVSTKEKEQETFRELRVDLARLGVDTVERLTRKKNKDGNLKESEKTRDQQVEVSTKQRTVTSKYILKEHSYSILSYAIKENIAANSGHLLKIYWEVTKNGTEFKEGYFNELQEQWYETYGHDIPGEHLSNYVYYLLNNSLISPFVLQTIWSAVAAKLPADKERPECPSFLPPRLSGHELIKRHYTQRNRSSSKKMFTNIVRLYLRVTYNETLFEYDYLQELESLWSCLYTKRKMQGKDIVIVARYIINQNLLPKEEIEELRNACFCLVRDDPENEQGTSEAITAAQDTQDETAATDANTEDDKSLFETIVLDDTQDDVTAEDPVIVMGIGLENVVPIVDDCSSPVQSYTSTVSDSENIEEINEDAIETIIIEDDGNENDSSFPVINIDDSPSEASIIETCNNTLQNVSKDSPIQAQTEETITVYGQVDGKDAVVTSNNYITKPQSIAVSSGAVKKYARPRKTFKNKSGRKTKKPKNAAIEITGENSCRRIQESNLDKGPSDDSALYTTSVKAGKSTSSKPTEMPESVTELIELPRCSEDLRAGRPKHQVGEECRVTPVLEIVSEEEFENCIIEIDPSDDVADDLQNGYYTSDLPNAENEDGAVTVFHNQAVGVADLESQSTNLESYGQVTNSVNQCDTGNDELIAVAGKQASISKKSAETATVRNQGQEMLGYALDSPSSTGGANKLTEETDLRNDVIQIGSDSGDSEDEYDISKPPTRVPTYKEYLENLKLLRIYTESILKGAVTNDRCSQMLENRCLEVFRHKKSREYLINRVNYVLKYKEVPSSTLDYIWNTAKRKNKIVNLTMKLKKDMTGSNIELINKFLVEPAGRRIVHCQAFKNTTGTQSEIEHPRDTSITIVARDEESNSDDIERIRVVQESSKLQKSSTRLQGVENEKQLQAAVPQRQINASRRKEKTPNAPINKVMDTACSLGNRNQIQIRNQHQSRDVSVPVLPKLPHTPHCISPRGIIQTPRLKSYRSMLKKSSKKAFRNTTIHTVRNRNPLETITIDDEVLQSSTNNLKDVNQSIINQRNNQGLINRSLVEVEADNNNEIGRQLNQNGRGCKSGTVTKAGDNNKVENTSRNPVDVITIDEELEVGNVSGRPIVIEDDVTDSSCAVVEADNNNEIERQLNQNGRGCKSGTVTKAGDNNKVENTSRNPVDVITIDEELEVGNVSGRPIVIEDDVTDSSCAVVEADNNNEIERQLNQNGRGCKSGTVTKAGDNKVENTSRNPVEVITIDEELEAGTVSESPIVIEDDVTDSSCAVINSMQKTTNKKQVKTAVVQSPTKGHKRKQNPAGTHFIKNIFHVRNRFKILAIRKPFQSHLVSSLTKKSKPRTSQNGSRSRINKPANPFVANTNIDDTIRNPVVIDEDESETESGIIVDYRKVTAGSYRPTSDNVSQINVEDDDVLEFETVVTRNEIKLNKSLQAVPGTVDSAVFNVNGLNSRILETRDLHEDAIPAVVKAKSGVFTETLTEPNTNIREGAVFKWNECEITIADNSLESTEHNVPKGKKNRVSPPACFFGPQADKGISEEDGSNQQP